MTSTQPLTSAIRPARGCSMLLCLLFVALTVVAGAEKCGTGPRRVFIDLGANWCNTLRLYEDLVDKETTLPDAPWEIFAFEASPLIAPYADRFVAWLNGDDGGLRRPCVSVGQYQITRRSAHVTS